MTHRTISWNAPYTFSGKEKDVETGHGYLGARYYDSGLSILLSVDPMSDSLLSLTPYNYYPNNPVVYNDPDGEIPIVVLCVVVEISFAAYVAYDAGTTIADNTITKLSQKLIKGSVEHSLGNKLMKYTTNGKIPTPLTDKKQCTLLKNRQSWVHNETWTLYKQSKTAHKGKESGEFKIFPNGTTTFSETSKNTGKHITITKEGDVLGH